MWQLLQMQGIIFAQLKNAKCNSVLNIENQQLLMTKECVIL